MRKVDSKFSMAKKLDRYLGPFFMLRPQYYRLFLDRLKKKSKTEKLKPQENNSKLKQKLKVSAKFLKITTNFDPILGDNAL